MHLKKISICDDNLVFLKVTGYSMLFNNKNQDAKCLYQKLYVRVLTNYRVYISPKPNATYISPKPNVICNLYFSQAKCQMQPMFLPSQMQNATYISTKPNAKCNLFVSQAKCNLYIPSQMQKATYISPKPCEKCNLYFCQAKCKIQPICLPSQM